MRVVPRAVDSDGPDACALAASYGLKPFEWQEDVLDGWLGRRKDDRWAAATCGLAVPRQNGKNAVIEVRELYGMAILGERFLHTAHEVKTARKAFLRICSFFENERQFPELAALVKDIRKTNGQEAVLLTNGGGVEFIARSKGSGRGFTVDVLVCDEAQELTDEELAALLPTISASPLGNPQVIVTGTPPDPDRPTQGEVFRRVRVDGEAKRDARLAWTDFGIADGPLPELTNELVETVNPSMAAGLLSMAEVDRERALMGDGSDTFARERYGWWGDPAATGSIFPTWHTLIGDMKPLTAFGIAADVNVTRFALAAAGDGFADLVTPAAFDSPTIKVADRALFVAEVARISDGAPVALQVKGPAWTLRTDLEEAGVNVVEVSMDDFVQACADIETSVLDGSLTHGGQPELAAAVRDAQWRLVGDRRVISRKKGDISPLEAVALALQAAKVPDYDVLASIY